MKIYLISLIVHFLVGLPYAGKANLIQVCRQCVISSLSDGLAKANAHDTLLLSKETYLVSNLEITKPISIHGVKGTKLDGEEKSYIIRMQSDSVHLHGLTFIHAGRSYTKDFAAIYASHVHYFSIKDCIVVNPFFGILIEKSHHGTIEGNEVYGSATIESDAGNGIHLWHSSDVSIVDNQLHGMRDGIYFEFVTDSQVERNHCFDNIRYGLHFMFSNNDEYYDNIFHDNGAGVAVMFSKFIQMKRNIFSKNWGTSSYGLLLKEIYDTEVVDNVFEQNTVAIFLEGTNRINYTHNQFLNNGWAVKVSGGCYANVFKENNFISNALDVSYNSKMNDNRFEGNYWSEYSGYDLDKNGAGDVPFRPVKLFSYIVSKTPETILLMRSLFIDILNFSERVSPIFTPDDLQDESPAMRAIQ